MKPPLSAPALRRGSAEVRGRHLRLLLRVIGALAVACISACSLPKPRLLDHDAIVQCGAKKLSARQWRNTLTLRFQLPGRNAAAVAGWPENGVAQAARLQSMDANRASFEAAWKAGQPVSVLGPEVWRRLVQNIANRLAPEQAGTAALLSLPGQDVLAIRSATGSVRLMPFTDRRNGMRVTKTYSDTDLAEILLREFGASLSGNARPVLISTGQEPPLVYFSAENHRIVFLHEPPPEVFGLPLPLGGLEKMSPRFAWRTAKSLVLSANALAVLNNPVSFVGHGIATSLSFLETLLYWRLLQPLDASPVPPVQQRPGMDLAAWERDLDRIADGPAVHSSVKFEIDGLEFFQPLIEAFQDARESIDLQVYIFDNDDYAVQIADLLRRRSADGIRVRILMDELGSLFATSSDPESPLAGGFDAPGNMVQYLERGSKIAVREIANPFLTSDHVKIITVDRRRAWFGGMNIGREYRYDWHDLMIEVTGPLVARIQRDFSQTWAGAGWGGDLGLLRAKLFPPRDRTRGEALPPDAIAVRPLYTKTFSHEIETAQLLAMRRAQRRIWIQNAYLTDDKVLTELIAARRRGVDVRIILPLRNDAGLIGASNLVTISDFLRNGIRVFAYPRMSHVKAALYDGWACVGTANFDRLSLRVNKEFDIGFSDPAKVRELESRLFLKDFADSTELKKPLPIPWTAHLAEMLANQL